jgi:hypothetical protein
MHIPYARPVETAVTRVADGLPATVAPAAGANSAIVRQRTDGFAVASAICGFTAIVPLVSQVIGLVLGIVGLARIRRARRAGIEVRGTRWAVAGITCSGFALLCWVAVFVAMSALGTSLSHSSQSLDALFQQAQ